MTNEKKAIDIFGISCDSWTLRENGDYAVGDKFFNALTFQFVEMELSQSMTTSIKKLDIDFYEGVGKILIIDKGPYAQTLLFDCGIYAYSYDILPKGIKSGSYVKMRFYLGFDDDDYFIRLTINGKYLCKTNPGMQYDWEIKDILVRAIVGKRGEKYFEDLPVAYVSPKGEIYKRIKKTQARVDCGGLTNMYILLSEMK
ncbi:MAG: hypothetical protein HQL01_08475 [Nitrospirae bacterium]|nr:hypothetical protein [Nitrospirota bacterium]